MIRNMQIRSKLIAVLVIPLVALTVLAALGIGANVARGVQADRVNDQTAFAVSLSTLVHELQRDLSAGWVGAAATPATAASSPSRSPSTRRCEPSAGTSRTSATRGRRSGSGSTRPCPSSTSSASSTDREQRRYHRPADARLLLRRHRPPAGRQPGDRQPDRRPRADPQRRRLRLPGLGVQGGDQPGAGPPVRGRLAGEFRADDFRKLAPVVGAQDAWRIQFEATATPEQRDFLERTLQSPDITRVEELRDKVLEGDPSQPVQLDPRQWST